MELLFAYGHASWNSTVASSMPRVGKRAFFSQHDNANNVRAGKKGAGFAGRVLPELYMTILHGSIMCPCTKAPALCS